MTRAGIFIVEDEEIVAEDIKASLTRQGFVVTGIASSGSTAIREISTCRPDLVLMDIMLQGEMTGIQAAETIFSRFNIPVVYLTAYSDDKILQQAKVGGLYGYIVKPFTESELKITIEVALYKHTIETRLRESKAELEIANEKLKREIEDRRLAEKALYNSEQRYALLIENAPDIIMNLDVDGRVLFANRPPSGITFDQLVGQNIFDFVPDKFSNTALQSLNMALETGQPQNMEIQGRLFGKWFNVRVGAIKYNKIVAGFTVIATDITGRKRMEDLLRIERDLAVILSAVSGLSEGLEACVDKILEIYGLNCAAVYLFNEKKDMLELIYQRGLSDDSLKRLSCFGADSYLPGIARSNRAVYAGRDGMNNFPDNLGDVVLKEKWSAVGMIPISHRNSVLGSINVASRDLDDIDDFSRNALELIAAQAGGVVARLKAEEDLKIKDFAISSSMNGIAIADLDGTLIYANDSLKKIWRLEGREMTGKHIGEYYNDLPAVMEVMDLLKKNGRWVGELKAKRSDGSLFDVLLSSNMVINDKGDPVCMMGSVLDISDRKQAEDALRASEERFRRLSEAAEEGIAIHDMGVINEANEAFARMFGYKLSELIGFNAMNLATPETWKVILDYIAAGIEEPYEGIGVRKDGSRFWARLTGKPYQYKGRTLRVATFSNITELKSAEELLRMQRDIMAVLGSTQDLPAAFDNILRILLQRNEIDCGGMYLVNANGDVDLISRTGFTPEFLERTSHYTSESPQARLVRDGKAYYQQYSEFSFSKDDVRQREGLRAMAILPVCHQGKPVACMNFASHTKADIPVNFRNMLESLAAQLGEIIVRIQTRKELENSEYKFATAFKFNSSMMAISTLEEGRFIEVNDEFLNTLGYSREEVIGKTSAELNIFGDIRQRAAAREFVEKSGYARNYELTVRAKSGQLRYCFFSAHVIQLNNETCWLTVAHDITERFRMETYLHIQHDLSIKLSAATEISEALDLVLEAGTSYEDLSVGGMYLFDSRKGLNIVISKNFSDDYLNSVSHYDAGNPRIEYLLKGIPIYLPFADSPDKALWQMESLKSVAILPILHQGKVVGCMNIGSKVLSEIPDSAKNFLESIASQVGGAISRLRFEEELKESEEKFRAITENSSDLIVIISIEGKFKYVSPALDRLLGYSPDELIGNVPSPYIYPDDVSLLTDAAARSLSSSGTPVPLRDFRVYMWNREVIILSGAVINMLNIRGVEGITGVFHDVTERKRMEEQIQNHNIMLQEAIKKTGRDMEELMEKHLRIEKLAAIGQIYGNIAHEIRNPLGAIKQSVFFLKRKMNEYPDKIKEHLELMDRELVKTNNVITNMLTSIDVKRTNYKIVDLHQILTESADRCRIDERIRLNIAVRPGKYNIFGDAVQLQQVFINLITNAVQSIEGGGNISISVKNTTGGKKVQVRVKDDGCGMDSDIIAKVFNPLYTTKKDGTGLGLGICKQIIEQHGGEIDLKSMPEQGTIVTITLPVNHKENNNGTSS